MIDHASSGANVVIARQHARPERMEAAWNSRAIGNGISDSPETRVEIQENT
jgi:hypothetical protein